MILTLSVLILLQGVVMAVLLKRANGAQVRAERELDAVAFKLAAAEQKSSRVIKAWIELANEDDQRLAEAAKGWVESMALADKILRTWEVQVKYGRVLEEILIKHGVPEPPCGWIFREQLKGSEPDEDGGGEGHD